MTKKQIKNKKSTKKPIANRQLRYINYLLFTSIVVFIVTIFIYYSKFDDEPKSDIAINVPAKDKKEEYIENRKDEFEEYTKEFEKEYIQDRVKDDVKKSEIVEKIDKDDQIKETSKKPKLAIVIDDVTTKTQVNSILDIDYIVNMSFLPPTKDHPNSAIVAQELPFYLVHFPMEAMNFKNQEAGTLMVGDSYERIEELILKVKEQYPNAIYINNHTGSKFTADAQSMDRLFQVLKKHNLIFLDSRTTAKTLAKEYAQKYDVSFLSRNIFLDNNINYDMILEQLNKAVAFAKQNGYAVAIGHPYKQTIEVLKNSKELLKDLDLVYIKDIPLQHRAK